MEGHRLKFSCCSAVNSQHPPWIVQCWQLLLMFSPDLHVHTRAIKWSLLHSQAMLASKCFMIRSLSSVVPWVACMHMSSDATHMAHKLHGRYMHIPFLNQLLVIVWLVQQWICLQVSKMSNLQADCTHCWSFLYSIVHEIQWQLSALLQLPDKISESVDTLEAEQIKLPLDICRNHPRVGKAIPTHDSKF